MKTTHTYHIFPRTLDHARLVASVEEFAKKRSMPTLGHGVFNLRVNNFEETECKTVEEFLSVMARTPVFDRLSSFQRWEGKGDKQVRVDIDVANNTVKVAVEAKDIDLVNAAHAYLSSEFNLRNPEIPRSDSSRALHPQPTIFLGRHFDANANEAAQPVVRFLELLGFDVIQGEEYHSRSIPDKVKALIERQDIYLGLVTGAREHEWLTAEIGYASGKSRYIMLLVEEGTKFNPTILGHDFEQARFPASTVEKSFVKLLAEFRNIRVRGI